MQTSKQHKKKKKGRERERERGFVTEKSLDKKIIYFLQFLTDIGPVPDALLSDVETTRAGRPVNSKFEVITESNDDSDV